MLDWFRRQVTRRKKHKIAWAGEAKLGENGLCIDGLAVGGRAGGHLLYLRGLAQQHALPWEPVPLPDPATTELHERAESHDWRFWLVTAVYLLCLGAIAAVPRTKELPAN